MELYSLFLIVLWLLPLWFSGWLLLPISRRIFETLPDGGLAAGRLLALVLVSLVAFSTATLHVIPLTFSSQFLIVVPIALFLFCLRFPLARRDFLSWIQVHRKALLVSDLVFVIGFLFFLYLRLCRPEIREQEKPMDSALIGVLARTVYLPADNPWLSGVPFTNYYYFGHFMSAMLTRVFSTPLPYAYNLVQPVFCAFFLSILWSFCAARMRSLKSGVLAMCIVALCGNYESLRQLFLAWQTHGAYWPLDWWSTSRVVPFTINEYPFFTLALGDSHAHFFALAMSALILCLWHSIHPNQPEPDNSNGRDVKSRWIFPAHSTYASIVLVGVMLGAIVMTNPWDAPLYFLLFGVNGFFTAGGIFRKLQIIMCWLVISLLVALPFLWHFKSPADGFAFELWIPPLTALLHWGPFLLSAVLMFACIALLKHAMPRSEIQLRPVLIVGIVAFTLPLFFYIKGHFEGDYRHQDTVFKFWLQAWLLIGVVVGCSSAKIMANPAKSLKLTLIKSALCLCWIVPAFTSLIVLSDRAKPSEFAGTLFDQNPPRYSLNGARFLSSSDQKLVSWLNQTATVNTTIVEAIGKHPDGSTIAAYTDFGRISFLTGIPTHLAWPQHLSLWGAPQQLIGQRTESILTFYSSRNATHNSITSHSNTSSPRRTDISAIDPNKQRLAIWGSLEHEAFGPPSPLFRAAAHFQEFPSDKASSTIQPSFAFTLPLE